MNPEVKLHLGKYRRYLWEERDLLIVTGDFEEVSVSKRLYEERYGVTSQEGEEEAYFSRLMGACALAAVSLADRESWGWTLTTAGVPRGYFCAVEPEGMICGTRREAPVDRNTVYVQRRKGDGPLVESTYTPASREPARVVEGYFSQAVQVRTRVALEESGSGVLVQALPGGDMDELVGETDEALIMRARALVDAGALKPMEEVLVFYECRCDDAMILDMITSLPAAQRREVWGDLDEITVECPRCSRSYTIARPPRDRS